MLASLYDTLARLGYPHPIHPTEVHAPIGLIVGALIFRIAAGILKRNDLARAAHFSIVLALILLIPTIVFGLMDWEHYYSGAWIPAIRIKIAATAILVVLVASAVLVAMKKGIEAKPILPLYVCAFATVVVIGYFGGNLVYGSAPSHAPPAEAAGLAIYNANCAGCHPKGGNVVDPARPVVNAPQLGSAADFVKFIRQPSRPDGSPARMPPFPPERISDADAAALYEYVTQLNR